VCVRACVRTRARARTGVGMQLKIESNVVLTSPQYRMMFEKRILVSCPNELFEMTNKSVLLAERGVLASCFLLSRTPYKSKQLHGMYH
jgi:hypothetical protein